MSHKAKFHGSDKIRRLTESIKMLSSELNQLSVSTKPKEQFDKEYSNYIELVNQLRNNFPSSVEWEKYYEKLEKIKKDQDLNALTIISKDFIGI